MGRLNRQPTPMGSRPGRWAAPWIGDALIAFALILGPWSLWLAATLPRRAAAYHWDVAWAGFDLLLAVALALTAVAVRRRSPSALTFAGIAAGMLICDAWFDVLTSSSQGRATAVAEAACIELPLAAACIWLAHRAGRTLKHGSQLAASAKRLLEARSIRVSRDRQLLLRVRGRARSEHEA